MNPQAHYFSFGCMVLGDGHGWAVIAQHTAGVSVGGRIYLILLSLLHKNSVWACN